MTQTIARKLRSLSDEPRIIAIDPGLKGRSHSVIPSQQSPYPLRARIWTWRLLRHGLKLHSPN